MLNNLIGAGMAILGVYWLIQGQTTDISTPPAFFIKWGGMTVVGLGVLAYNLIPLIKNIRLPNLSGFLPKKTIMANSEIKVGDNEEKDITALYYITERFLSVEDPALKEKGLQLCKEINGLLFDIHHALKKSA